MKESSLSSDKIEQAIAKCLQLIKNDPESAEIHANLGELYIQQQNWTKALDCYEKIVSLKPFSSQAHRNLARVYTATGNESKVTDHLFALFKSDPNAFTGLQLYDLGQVLLTQNKLVRAISCYRGAIELQPDLYVAYKILGETLATKGKQKQSLEVYRLGVRNNPQNPDYYHTLAKALESQSQWLWASKNYQQVCLLQPNASNYYLWGVALFKAQKYTQAKQRLNQAQKLEKSAFGYYYLGLTLRQLGQLKQAVSCWQEATSLQADFEAAYYQLGLLWQDQKHWQKAIAAYKNTLGINPQSVETLKNIGQVYHNLEQSDLAIKYLSQAIQISSEGSELEKETFTSYQEILTTSTTVKSLDYYKLARLFRARSLFPQAIYNYQQSIKLDPYFRDAYIALQYTPVAPDQLEDLIQFYRQLVTEYPDITIAWGNLGDALTQNDCVSEAIECYRKASYQQAVQTYPQLAQLTWKQKKECGPDFIVAGASKSGTSSIYFYLSRHPQILLSHTKEIDFYWQNYKRGIDWYLAHFPTVTDQDDFLTGEATPNYLRFPQVAKRIKNTFPQTKIIILLRNPADRAISWHYHKLNTGLTNQSLAPAIAEEMERLKTVSESEITNTGFYNPDNILSSLYVYKIKPWIELLGREQFLILKSEDFYSDPLNSMSQVFEFLGLPNCTLESYPKVNAGSYSEVDSELRTVLADYFTPYNRQLEEYLDIEFNWH